MNRNTIATLIRLVVWTVTVAVTITAGFLLVDETHRNGIFWLTVSSLLLLETLWVSYPTMRVMRPNLPLPLSAIFILVAYSAVVAVLAIVACTVAVLFSVLLTLHLVSVLAVLVIPFGIVFLGGNAIAEINEKHADSRATHIRFRNQFSAFNVRLAATQSAELAVARQLAAKQNDDLAYTVTESVPAVAAFDQELDALLAECAAALDTCEAHTGTPDRQPLQTAAETLTQKLQAIKQKLSDRETINKQHKHRTKG